jgi:lysophospholipase L1-like esterase
MTLPILAVAALMSYLAMPSAFAADQSIRVILVGDSTMASKSGYGDALCARFTTDVECHNLARGGRSSSSFRAEKRWDEVQQLLNEGNFAATYVLVQFGHNDQPGKGERSTDLATQFPANMARYAAESRALGGVPVLITPLTRRDFKGTAYVKDDLGPWAAATRAVAAQEKTALLDLNADSLAAVNAMGEAEADKLSVSAKPKKMSTADAASVEVQGAPQAKFDYTHVGIKGAAYFAEMVQRELVSAIPATRSYFKQ